MLSRVGWCSHCDQLPCQLACGITGVCGRPCLRLPQPAQLQTLQTAPHGTQVRVLLRAPRVMYGSSGSSTSAPPPAQDPPAARGVQWPIGALPAGMLQGGFLGLSQADLLAAGGQATWPPAPAGAHAHAPAQPPPSLPQLLAALSPAAVSPMRGVKPEAPGEHWAGAPTGMGPGGAPGNMAQALDGDASWSLGSQVRCQLAVLWQARAHWRQGLRRARGVAFKPRPGVVGTCVRLFPCFCRATTLE